MKAQKKVSQRAAAASAEITKLTEEAKAKAIAIQPTAPPAIN
jgi:hypothetical protein